MSPRAGLPFYCPWALRLRSRRVLFLGGHAAQGSVLGAIWMRDLTLHPLSADRRQQRPLKQAEPFKYPAVCADHRAMTFRTAQPRGGGGGRFGGAAANVAFPVFLPCACKKCQGFCSIS